MELTINFEKIERKLGLEMGALVASAAGFDSTDYMLEEMTARDNRFHRNDYRATAENMASIFCNADLPVRQAHAPFRFTGYADPVEFESFIYPSIVRSVEIASILGASLIVVHPLHYSVYRGHEEEIFERNMAFYRSLIPVCKEYGIKVGIENMWQWDRRRGHITHDTCSTIPEFCRYIDTLDSEYMVGCLDIGHVTLPEQDDEPWDFIRALGHDRLHALHVHDNNYKEDQHKVPYSGLIDWNCVTQALGEINYRGNFTYELDLLPVIENLDPELVPAALKYLANIGHHLIDLVERNRK